MTVCHHLGLAADTLSFARCDRVDIGLLDAGVDEAGAGFDIRSLVSLLAGDGAASACG